ncbi:hypothetical protein Ddc_14190 [Ditylenchus destructor]|nr:hypothetical protein Ddc_14190 [Ditylenchus destructor]
MGETKSFDRIRKWLANKKNAAIFASILGIVASEMLMAAKILVITLTSHTYWNYMANFILFFISSLVFFLAFRGLKKERESIVLIFIFAEGIILFFMGIDALRSLYILIAHPGCEIYWPFVNLSYCEYDSSFSRLFFQYIPYGTIIYFILSSTRPMMPKISPQHLNRLSPVLMLYPVHIMNHFDIKISHLAIGRLFLTTGNVSNMKEIFYEQLDA